MTDPRFPVGKFALEGQITAERREQWIVEVGETPARMRAAVHGLTEAQFDTPYREGGWTVRQLVHHVPDSHLNAYIRFKLALTEDNPTIKPYEEAKWAELADTRNTAVGVSLMMLDALHRRWVMLMRGLAEEDWTRTYFHPERKLKVRLDLALAEYAWHGRHHVAHITSLRDQMGWH